MASTLNISGTSCAYPVLRAIPPSIYRGARRDIQLQDVSSSSSVSFARKIPPKARLQVTAVATVSATQTQTVQRKSTRIPNGSPSKVMLKPKLDQGGGGFPPYRGGSGGGGGGGGGYGRSSGGFVLFVIIMLLDYMKELEKKWFKFDDDDYYNQLNF